MIPYLLLSDVFTHIQEFKIFCTKFNLCVKCTDENSDKPIVLPAYSLLYSICDYDEYLERINSKAKQ